MSTIQRIQTGNLHDHANLMFMSKYFNSTGTLMFMLLFIKNTDFIHHLTHIIMRAEHYFMFPLPL